MKSQVSPLFVYGLKDLIAGVTPTYSGWDADPTDGADLGDDDPSTFCTTGSKAAAAYSYGFIEYDLGGLYYVLIGGYGSVVCTAGRWRIYPQVYLNGAWHWINGTVASSTVSSSDRSFAGYALWAEKIRFGITSDAISTNSPHINSLNAWRLK